VKIQIAILLSIGLMSSAPIQQQTIVSTPAGQSQTAGMGDLVLRAEGPENMPNRGRYAQ